MSTTRPSEPDPMTADEADTGAPNPTNLPVEPEFGQQMPSAEPEDPGAQKPPI